MHSQPINKKDKSQRSSYTLHREELGTVAIVVRIMRILVMVIVMRTLLMMFLVMMMVMVKEFS